MSSHHFVKEGQEPTILVATPYPNREVLAQLLEWGSTLCATAEALPSLLAFGTKVDEVFCLTNEVEKIQQMLVPQAPYYTLHRLDEVSTPNCLAHLGMQPLNVLLSDFSEVLALEAWTSQTPIVAYVESWRGTWIPAEQTYRKWLPAQTALQFISASPLPQHPFHNVHWKPESNAATIQTAGIVSLVFDESTWVFEKIIQ